MNLSFLNSTYKWDFAVFVFCVWLISLSIMSSKLTHIVANGRISFFLKSVIFLYVYISHIFIIHLSILFPLVLYTEVGLLGHMVVLAFIFWKTSVLFSITSAPNCIPTRKVQRFPFLPFLLANTYCILSFWSTAILMCEWYFTVVLMCISLMICDVEHFFMNPLVICVVFEKNVCSDFYPLLNWVIGYFAIELYGFLIYTRY